MDRRTLRKSVGYVQSQVRIKPCYLDIMAEGNLDLRVLSGEHLCDKSMFKIERDVFSAKELTQMWTITCKYDK